MGIFYIRRHVHFRLWCFGWDGLLGSGTRLVAKLVLACFPDVRIVITFNAYPTVEGSEMKHSTLLRRAKRHLRTEIYICCAIDAAVWDFPSDKLDWNLSHELCVKIHSALYPHRTVDDWLCARGYKPTDNQLLDYRRRWLDELIRIYEEAGK